MYSMDKREMLCSSRFCWRNTDWIGWPVPPIHPTLGSACWVHSHLFLCTGHSAPFIHINWGLPFPFSLSCLLSFLLIFPPHFLPLLVETSKQLHNQRAYLRRDVVGPVVVLFAAFLFQLWWDPRVKDSLWSMYSCACDLVK